MPIARRLLHFADRLTRATVVVAFACFAPIALRAQLPDPADASTGGLPLTEVPARRPGDALAIFLTGDGGFAELDRQIAHVLADSGIAVVALDTRSYLWQRRTPDETAHDVARIVRHYAAEWHREKILLAGYSHGADILPFAASRLPADVAPRVALLAMLGLGTGASFQFHFADLLRDIQRKSDLPIGSELEKLRGHPMLCIYGTEEDRSACRDADPALITRRALPGDHHFDRAYAAIATMLVGSLRR